MVVAAAEAAVGLAIIIAVYRTRETLNVDQVTCSSYDAQLSLRHLWLIPHAAAGGRRHQRIAWASALPKQLVTTIALAFPGAAFVLALVGRCRRLSPRQLRPYHRDLAHWIRVGKFLCRLRAFISTSFRWSCCWSSPEWAF